uniref:UGSC-like domain-containing protein n=1 Tax=Coccolithus braarudii TaxID=221442 RepID=A0A7S0LAM2_9EUKA
MHDVSGFERAGIPAVAILSEPFASLGVFQAQALGIEAKEAQRLIVLAEHPISDQLPHEMKAKAEKLFDDLLHALTSNERPSLELRRRLRMPASSTCLAGA